MKIYNSPIYNQSTYNVYNNQTHNKAISPRDINQQQFLQRTTFSIPSFGKKEKENETIKELLEGDKLSPKEKRFLKKLTKIEGFELATIGTPEERLYTLLKSSMILSPFMENLFKGNYVMEMNSSNDKKPILDLKAIAEYNQKHPNTPKNLLEDIGTNPLVQIVLELIKMTGNANMPAAAFEYQIGDLSLDVEITKLANKKSSTTIDNPPALNPEELKSYPTPSAVHTIIKQSKNQETQKAAYELGENSYFNAAMQNAEPADLKNIVILQKYYPQIMKKILDGKMYITSEDAGLCLNKLVDWERHIEEKTPPNKILQKGSFESDVCKFIGSELGETDFTHIILALNENYEVDVTIIDKNQNQARYVPMNVPKSIIDFLQENTTFTIFAES